MSLRHSPIALFIWVSSVLCARADTLQPTSTIAKLMNDLPSVESAIADLESTKRWVIILTVGTIIFGTATTVIQAANRQWSKTAIMILGGLVAGATTTNASFFKIDYSTCQVTIDEARALIHSIKTSYASFEKARDSGNATEMADWLNAIVADKEKLENLHTQLQKSGHTLGLTFVVFAQASQMPLRTTDYVSQTGSGAGATQEAAYEAARTDAVEKLARSLLKSAGPEDLSLMKEYVLSKAQITKSECTIAQGGRSCTVTLRASSFFLNPDIANVYVAAGRKMANVEQKVTSALPTPAKSRVQMQCRFERPDEREAGKAIAQAFARVAINIENESDAPLTIKGVALRKGGVATESLTSADAEVARFRLNDGRAFGAFINEFALRTVRAHGNAYGVVYFPVSRVRDRKSAMEITVRLREDNSGNEFEVSRVPDFDPAFK